MKKLADWNPSIDPLMTTRKVMAFDMDDTLTHNGSLPSSVLVALESLQKQNILTILVTGRPAGWADCIVKLLPFDGVVAENGALLFWWPSKKTNRKSGEEPQRLFWTPSGYQAQRPRDLQQKLDPIREEVLKTFPQVRVASDQPYRIYDLAIDFAEEVVPPLGLKEAEAIQKIFESHKAIAKISSIHVNGWFGQFSKVNGLERLLKEYQYSLTNHVVYMGDSPNDGPLFEAAGISIGVANIHHFMDLPFSKPKFITQKEASEGSIEAIEYFKSFLKS